jgi:hypothetical protein
LPLESNKYYEKTFLKLQEKPSSHVIRISFPGAIGSLHYYLESKKALKSVLGVLMMENSG